MLGNWTRRLEEVLTGGYEWGSRKELKLKVYMEGPYGAPAVDLESEEYQIFLLISGGIGITPMQSICNELVHQHDKRGRSMKKVKIFFYF